MRSKDLADVEFDAVITRGYDSGWEWQLRPTNSSWPEIIALLGLPNNVKIISNGPSLTRKRAEKAAKKAAKRLRRGKAVTIYLSRYEIVV